MSDYKKENMQVTLFSTGNQKVAYSGTMFVTKAGLEAMIEELDSYNVDEANIDLIAFIHGFEDKRGVSKHVINTVRANQKKIDEKGIISL